MGGTDKTHDSTAGGLLPPGASGDVRGAAKDAIALQVATRETDRGAELRRYKRYGLALIFGSFGALVLPIDLAAGPLYLSSSLAGVFLYTKSKQRSLWWALLGLYPVLGPLLSLWILSWKPKPRTEMDFRGGSIVSTIAAIAGIFLTSSALLELAESIYLQDQWYPLQQPGGAGLLFLLSPFFLCVVSVIVHLNKYEFAPTNELKPFLITEAIFVGLFLLSFINSSYITSKIVDLHEVRTENALSQLRVGMSKRDVGSLVFEANANLVAPPREERPFRTSEHQDKLYRRVQQALQSVRTGKAADFSIFGGREYFVSQPNKAGASIQRFRRTYNLGIFHDIGYELSVKYDDAGRLLWARYVSETYNDGPGPCRVVTIGDSAPAWDPGLCLDTERGKWNTAADNT